MVRLFVQETTLPVLCGLAAGLFCVYSLTTLLQQQAVLFEVRRFEPGLYGGVTLAQCLLALGAARIPAARIPRAYLSTGLLDPVVTSIEVAELVTLKLAFDEALAILHRK